MTIHSAVDAGHSDDVLKPTNILPSMYALGPHSPYDVAFNARHRIGATTHLETVVFFVNERPCKQRVRPRGPQVERQQQWHLDDAFSATVRHRWVVRWMYSMATTGVARQRIEAS